MCLVYDTEVLSFLRPPGSISSVPCYPVSNIHNNTCTAILSNFTIPELIHDLYIYIYYMNEYGYKKL